MKPVTGRTDKTLLGIFLLSMAVYLAVLISAFWDLPLNIPPWRAT